MANSASFKAPKQLEHSLKLIDSTMIVVGSMIGSGIFLLTAQMPRDLGSAGWLLFSWTITVILTLVAALFYGELATIMPCPTTQNYGNLYSNMRDYVIAAALLFYIAIIAAVFQLRRTCPGMERWYVPSAIRFCPPFTSLAHLRF